MDGGYLEAEMMAQAGASMVVVMGVAHPATIRAVVRAARDYGIQVMGDIMAAPDKVACARMLEANGVDYIIVHTGFDERHEETGLSPLDDLPAITQAVSIPVQAVGGLTIEQMMRLPGAGRAAGRGRRAARHLRRGLRAPGTPTTNWPPSCAKWWPQFTASAQTPNPL